MTSSRSTPQPNSSSRIPDDTRSTTPVPSKENSQSVESSASQDSVILVEPRHAITEEYFGSHRATPPPLNTTPSLLRTTSVPSSGFPSQAVHAPIPAQRSISMTMGNLRHHGEDSPVMNETLSVIDEHIIDMNTPRSSLLAVEQRCMNDSGSDYSTHIDHRLSYINGHETDEEERNAHTEREVMKWTPEQVAEFLQDVGVEKRHCEVFKEQEISGEVLLDMDQASVFMKEFDLGLVGRRLRTWHKIKALQEEVKTHKSYNFKNLHSLRNNGSSDDLERAASRASTNGSMLPRIPSLIDRTGSKPITRQASQGSPRLLHPQPLSQLQVPTQETVSLPSTATFNLNPDSPRPSAASIRELNHSRRHSSVDFNSSSPVTNLKEERSPISPTRNLTLPHKKQPSFDRNWTMGESISPTTATGRPTSALGSITHSSSLSTGRDTLDPSSPGPSFSISPSHENDRGYASGGELENKKTRNVLRKRDVVSASHSRQSSYKEEQQRKSIAGSRRHSRFGSADSIRDTLASVNLPTSKMNFGNSIKGRFSTSIVKEKSPAASSRKVSSPPVVTKLDKSDNLRTNIAVPSPEPDIGSPNTSQESSPRIAHTRSSPKPRMGLRAVSDTATESEKATATSPSAISPVKESPLQSPTRTGSTTTSSGASKSFELESTDASSKGTSIAFPVATPSGHAMRRKSKKTTSAYTRGLEKRSPKEQMEDCDYSGWMKKKSPSLITTWKPRLFVLRGRRLSYYYTENDTEEKGLIDISSHRVLSADNERITGLHATFTGAKSSPTSPSNAQTPTINSTEAAAQPDSTLQKSNTDSIFIFKLVPPRTGLSRAVNFTKPTVHYFAVDNVKQGRLWMAALMKATINRDDTEPIVSTYQQKTISLTKAKAMRYRPPALMGLDEKSERRDESPEHDKSGLNIQGLDYTGDDEEAESVKEPVNEITPPAEQPTAEPTVPVKSNTESEAPNETGKNNGLRSEKRRKSSVKEVADVEVLFGAMMSMKGHR